MARARHEDDEVGRLEAAAVADAEVLAARHFPAVEGQRGPAVAPALHDQRHVLDRRGGARGEGESERLGRGGRRALDDPGALAGVVVAARVAGALDLQAGRALPRARERGELGDAGVAHALEVDLGHGVAGLRDLLPPHVGERGVARAVRGEGVAAVRGLERGRPVVPPGVDADVAAHLARVDVEARLVLPPRDRERLVARAGADELDARALGLLRLEGRRRLLPRDVHRLAAAVREGEPDRREGVVRRRAGAHHHDALVPLALGVGQRACGRRSCGRRRRRGRRCGSRPSSRPSR